MITTRQIERLWQGRSYAKLSETLLAGRQENTFGLEGADRPCFVAALAMIRLDELNQTHQPLFSTMLKVVLSAQDRDGGFGDPATTALCLRALLIDAGHGVAVDAAFGYLSALQKEEGAWPAGPMRRMPADAATSLFVLYQLAAVARFRSGVQFKRAIAWMSNDEAMLPPLLRSVCQSTLRRCAMLRVEPAREESPALFAA